VQAEHLREPAGHGQDARSSGGEFVEVDCSEDAAGGGPVEVVGRVLRSAAGAPAGPAQPTAAAKQGELRPAVGQMLVRKTRDSTCAAQSTDSVESSWSRYRMRYRVPGG